MTRPRPTVAEVIRSCLDEFLDEYGRGADARATPRPEGPDRLPHGGPGRSRPGVPRVRASADRLQLLRQPPLPHLPGHGRGTVAGGPRRGVAPRAVLPPRLHAPGCPRPDRPGQSAGRLRPAVAVRRRDRARGGRRSRAPGCPDRRAGRAAHLGPEPAVPPARPLRRARWRVVAGRHALGRLAPPLLPAGAGPEPGVPRQVPGGTPRGVRQRAAPSRRRVARRPRPSSSGWCRRRSAPTGWCMPSRRSAAPSRC